MKRRTLLTLGLLLAAGCSPQERGNKKPRVRLGYFPNVTHAAALYGSAQGLFANALGESATLEERVFKAGPEEIEALFAGEVDLGYIGPGPAINGFLKSRGEALQIVAGASSGGVALVARKGVAITTLKDLAGKRVVVPQKGGTQDISLRHFLKATGLATKEQGGSVEVVQYAPSDTYELFQRGALDAAWLPEPWVSRLEREQGATVVLEEKTLWPGGRFATTVVLVRSGFLKEHPELVARLLAAHADSIKAITTKPEAARRAICAKLKDLTGKPLPDPLLQAALGRTELTTDPLRESILTLADWSKELGYLREGREALATLFAEGTK